MNVLTIMAIVSTSAGIFLLVSNVIVTMVTNWPTTADLAKVGTTFFTTRFSGRSCYIIVVN